MDGEQDITELTTNGLLRREAEGWQLVLPCCITNGYEGYFPTMEAYLEGGYEARSSNFTEPVATELYECSMEMLKSHLQA